MQSYGNFYLKKACSRSQGVKFSARLTATNPHASSVWQPSIIKLYLGRVNVIDRSWRSCLLFYHISALTEILETVYMLSWVHGRIAKLNTNTINNWKNAEYFPVSLLNRASQHSQVLYWKKYWWQLPNIWLNSPYVLWLLLNF